MEVDFPSLHCPQVLKDTHAYTQRYSCNIEMSFLTICVTDSGTFHSSNFEILSSRSLYPWDCKIKCVFWVIFPLEILDSLQIRCIDLR